MYYSQIHHQHRFRHILTTSLSSLIGLAGGLIVLILATRYVLSFIEINELPSFTSTVYNLSYPFVAPIAKLFSQVAVQSQVLIAIAFWSVATWILASITSLADTDS